MKIPYLIVAVLFIVFAAVQWNDPDPWVWIGLYGFVAMMYGFAAFGKYNRWVVWAGIATCVIQLAVTLPGVVDYLTNQDGYTLMEGMSNEKPYIELTREFGGSLIAGIALAVLAIRIRHQTLF